MAFVAEDAMRDTVLGIPTIRPQSWRTAGEYADNLRRHGHRGVTLLVADDAAPGTAPELADGLARLATDHPGLTIACLGPQEKACYLARLEERVKGAALLLGQGYGGNRNWLLLASLGRHLVVEAKHVVHP